MRSYSWADYPSCRLTISCYSQLFPNCSKICKQIRKHLHFICYKIQYIFMLCLLMLSVSSEKFRSFVCKWSYKQRPDLLTFWNNCLFYTCCYSSPLCLVYFILNNVVSCKKCLLIMYELQLVWSVFQYNVKSSVSNSWSFWKFRVRFIKSMKQYGLYYER